MEKLLLVPLMGVLMYLLYAGGYMVSGSKRAVMFIGSARGKKARFFGCSGTIKRVVRFAESREYRFVLSTELSKGEVLVELQDRKKQSVLCLDSHVREGFIAAEAGKRYDLVIHFQSASGSYELDWS